MDDDKHEDRDVESKKVLFKNCLNYDLMMNTNAFVSFLYYPKMNNGFPLD